MMIKTKKIVIILLAVLAIPSAFSQEKKKVGMRMDEMWGETAVLSDANLAERAKLFDESNFGMFIHWGLFSNLSGEWGDKTYYGIVEWLMHPRMANIPAKEYRKIAKDFNPQGFDAKKIAQLAKDAGMKYIIITSKHHDGFAMFETEYDDFNIVDAAPFGRDPMHELADACHELGLGFGFYYSHNQDWTSPGATGGPKTYADGSEASFEEYFYKKCKPQVKEICTNYGDIDFVWFDTPGRMKKELVIELADMVRELQPNAMLCSRVGHGMGDYASNGDMEVPPANIEGLWETCDTNNDSWGYTWYDNNFKSSKKLLQRLISTVARGGTYLLNVGPNDNGQIPEVGAQFLEETGEWIKKYPQVVYSAGCSPWGHALPWGDVTTQGNSLFLSVYDWPQDGKLHLPGLESKIASAKLLGNKKGKKLSFKQDDNWTEISVPHKPADSSISVIELSMKMPAKDVIVKTDLGIYPNVETELIVQFAKVTGVKKSTLKWMEKFGEWKHIKQVSKWTKAGKASWTVEVKEPGYYYLELRYKGEGRLVWRAESNEGVMVQNQLSASQKYQNNNMGIFEFKEAGLKTISVSLIEGNPKTSSLESIKFIPVK